MEPRILIVSASVGTGHVRAAEALELALKQTVPPALVRNVDAFRMCTAVFRRCYAETYLDLIERAPLFLAYIYNLMDRPRPAGHDRWYRLRVSLEKMSMRPFLHLLQAEPWDLIVNTFFLPAEIVADLRRRGRLRARQAIVVTDFETHRNWVNHPCDHYFTATEEAARYLECFGVPRGATTVTGIPVHPVFSIAKDRSACRARLGLAGSRPVILLLTGGHGVGPVVEIYTALLAVERPLTVVAVTGHNAAVRSELATVPVPRRHGAKLFGYTDRIDELLAAADLVVSKPGGLTVAEALARGVGMVLVHPVPGQEERNSDFLLENGAAIKVNHVPTLPYKLTALLADPCRLQQLRASARRLGRPRAAFQIVDRCLELIQESRWPARTGRRTGNVVAAVRNGNGHLADPLAPFRSRVV
jgi:processive 1,2-diacylglycerol beta-glucosyltransferase